tara:strand:- start:584 stop:1252 length:669 start_codon:yes stop_codon:yes gene_type:complete
MGYITELKAINHMLLMAGESPVTQAELTAGGIDVSTAQTLLEQYTEDFLMRGTVGNRIITKTTLTTAGQILLGNDVMSAELVTYHANSEGDRIFANIRGMGATDGRYLYNITDQTSTWSAGTEYCLELIYDLPWVDIDTPYQRAIMAAAARQYQIVMQGDGDTDAYLSQAEAFYSAKAKAANTDDRRRHVFDQVPRRARESVLRQDVTSDPTRFRYWRHTNG